MSTTSIAEMRLAIVIDTMSEMAAKTMQNGKDDEYQRFEHDDGSGSTSGMAKPRRRD
jgi:hypothetical protein